MAIEVAYNALVTVNAVDLTNHTKSVTIDDGQETREVTAMGNTSRVYRAGLGTQSVSFTFHNDHANGSVENTLRALLGTASSSGVSVVVRKKNAVLSTSNPQYTFTAIPDGGLQIMNDSVGDVPEISIKFVPYSGGFTIATTS